MSGLFAKHPDSVSSSSPALSSLHITTTCYGRPVPVGWGLFRAAGFLMWYGNFLATPHTTYTSSGGKGGGGGQQQGSTTFTYSAACAVGLCEGPVNTDGARKLWKGKNFYDTPVTPPPSPTTATRTETSLPITGTGTGNVTLHPPGPIVGATSLSVLYRGQFHSPDVLKEGDDYARTGSSITGIASKYRGLFASALYSYDSTVRPLSPLAQLNAVFFGGGADQVPWDWLLANYPTQSLAYRHVAYLASPVYDLGTSSDFPNTSAEVDSTFGFSEAVRDCNPRDFLIDFLTNSSYGANFDPDAVGDWTDYSTYCTASGLFVSPYYDTQEKAADILTRVLALTNSECILSEGLLKVIPYADQAITGNGVTFTPDLVAVYALDADNLLPNGDGGPISLARKAPDERYNLLRAKFQNRDFQYNDDVVECKDETEIALNGLRPAPTDADCSEIKDKAVATVACNLMLQRIVNVCNTFSFKLPFNYVGLEPMDLVTLTYPRLRLDGALVRITQIEEDTDGALAIEAEEVPAGFASAILYPHAVPLGLRTNYAVDPGNVLPPVLFEAPVDLAAPTGLLVYAAVSGAGEFWGGANVWVSLTGADYKRVGKILGGSRYGHITTDISATDSSVGVQMVGRAQQLLSGSADDAAALATRFWVDGALDGGEYMAYETATLTGVGAYTLSGLVRSAYRTTAQAHLANAGFARLDDSVADSGPLDEGLIGSTINFKFQSFNVYGAGLQDLENVTAYQYTIRGGMARLPPPDVTGFTITGTLLRWEAVSEAFAPDLLGYELRFQYGSNTDWNTATVIHVGGVVTATQYDWSIRPAGTVTIMCRAVDNTFITSMNSAIIITDLGDAAIANAVWSYDFRAEGWPGTQDGCSVSGGDLVATGLDLFFTDNSLALFFGSPERMLADESHDPFFGPPMDPFFGLPGDPFFGGTGSDFLGDSTQPFFDTGSYGTLIYTSTAVTPSEVLAGSLATLELTTEAPALFTVEYRLGTGTSGWLPWPGQVLADATSYQFRVTIGYGATQGKITAMRFVVDAPDIVESIGDVVVSDAGTAVPYTKPFAAILSVQATLQANGSGGVTVEIDKTDPLHPVASVYNVTHTAVAGALVDFVLIGY